MKSMLTLVLLSLAAVHAFGGEDVKELKVGDAAPDVTATDENGKSIKLSSFKDKQGVVIFFFPKAFTGGCTKETCAFRDESGAYKEKGYVVFGASRDDGELLTKFKTEYKCDYDFFSDPKGELAKAFGLSPGLRQSVIIGKDGKIEKIYKTVNAVSHAADILKELGEKK